MTEFPCPDVRLAVRDDAANVFNLMSLAHEEAGEHPMNPQKVIARIWAGVNHQGSLIGVIGDVGAPLRGYVLMCLVDVWYSNDLMLQEFSLFIHPEHRRSDYAKQLMQFSKKCSHELGIELMIGVLSNERVASKIRLYERQFNKAGAYFTYRPG